MLRCGRWMEVPATVRSSGVRVVRRRARASGNRARVGDGLGQPGPRREDTRVTARSIRFEMIASPAGNRR